MSIYKIVTKEDKILRKTCKPVPEITPNVKKLLDYNKMIRHIRGGESTKHKYEEIKYQKY